MKLARPLFAPHMSFVERAWYVALRVLVVLTLLYLILPVLAIVPLSFFVEHVPRLSDPGLLAALVRERRSSASVADGATRHCRGRANAPAVARARVVRQSRSSATPPCRNDGAATVRARLSRRESVTFVVGDRCSGAVRADQTTLPRQMFTGIRENISPTIAALATILIIFSTSLLLALEWLRGRNARRAVT